MTYFELLQIASAWAAIATAVVAVVAYAKFMLERADKVRKLENHLQSEKALGADQGQRSILHLMARLRMTESDLLGAAFRSKKVRCITPVDWQGRAESLMFEYED